MNQDHISLVILRNLIGDFDEEDQQFTDSRLQDILLVAAYQVNLEFGFGYDIDILNVTTNDYSADSNFIYLLTLKAACIIDRGSVRAAAALEGVEAKCGPAMLSLKGKSAPYIALLKDGYCSVYEEAKRQYILGNASYIQAILSPFVNSNYLPDVQKHNYR